MQLYNFCHIEGNNSRPASGSALRFNLTVKVFILNIFQSCNRVLYIQSTIAFFTVNVLFSVIVFNHVNVPSEEHQSKCN